MDCTLAAECSSGTGGDTIPRGDQERQLHIDASGPTGKQGNSHRTDNSRKFMTIELRSANSLHVFPIISRDMMLYKSGTGQQRTTNISIGTFVKNRFVLENYTLACQ